MTEASGLMRAASCSIERIASSSALSHLLMMIRPARRKFASPGQ
jgi:hypothetical protein